MHKTMSKHVYMTFYYYVYDFTKKYVCQELRVLIICLISHSDLHLDYTSFQPLVYNKVSCMLIYCVDFGKRLIIAQTYYKWGQYRSVHPSWKTKAAWIRNNNVMANTLALHYCIYTTAYIEVINSANITLILESAQGFDFCILNYGALPASGALRVTWGGKKKQFQVTEQCLVTSADPPSRVLLQGWLARVQAKLLIVVHGVLVSRSLNCTNSNSKC